MLRFFLMFMVVVPFELMPTKAFIDCRTACRRCREGFDEVSILEVYCSMCKECRDRRRDRLAQQTLTSSKFPATVMTQTMEPTYYKEILDHDIRRAIARGRRTTKRIARHLNIEQQLQTWPEHCPTPPLCSDEIESMALISTSTTTITTRTTTTATTTTTTTTTTPAPTCPPIHTCRPRTTTHPPPSPAPVAQQCCMPACVMPCMPCVPNNMPNKMDVNINWNGGNCDGGGSGGRGVGGGGGGSDGGGGGSTGGGSGGTSGVDGVTNYFSEIVELISRTTRTTENDWLDSATLPQDLQYHTPPPSQTQGPHHMLLHTTKNPLAFTIFTKKIQPTECNQNQILGGKVHFNGQLDLDGLSLQTAEPCITNNPGQYKIPGGNINPGKYNIPGGNINPGQYNIPGGNMNIHDGNINKLPVIDNLNLNLGTLPPTIPGGHIKDVNIPGGYTTHGNIPNGFITDGLINNPLGPNHVQDDYVYLYIGVPKSLGVRKPGRAPPMQIRRTPGFVNSGFVNPGFVNPSFVNPGFVNPNLANPDFINYYG